MKLSTPIKLGIFIALKNMFKNKGIFIFIIIVISLGFLNVSLLTAFMDGFSNRLNDNLIEKQYGSILIDAAGDERYIKNTANLLDKLRRVPGVTGVTKRYILGATIKTEKGDKQVTPWFLQSVNSDENSVTTINKDLISGEFLNEHDADSIILGSQLIGAGQELILPKEDTLQVKTGDKVKVSYENGIEKTYKVQGIIDPKDFYAALSAYITEEEAEQVLNLKDQASLIIIRVPRGKEQIYVNKFKKLGIKEDIKPWQVKSSTTKILTKSFDLINNIFRVSGILIVFTTIIIIVYITLLNSKRQIGIIRAVGIGPKTIMTTYIFMGIIYSLCGILLGSFILLLSTQWFKSHPLNTVTGLVMLSINIKTYIISILTIIIASIIGGALPAYKYTQKNIIKLIWG